MVIFGRLDGVADMGVVIHPGLTMRRATIRDEETLIRLRQEFMGIMGHTADDGGALLGSIGSYVNPAMNSGQLDAILVEDQAGNVVANGWAIYVQKAPHPYNPTGLEGYLLNIYTAPEFRRKGLATRLVEELVSICREKGAKVVRLIASGQGKPVYEKLGFTADDGAMKLTL